VFFPPSHPSVLIVCSYWNEENKRGRRTLLSIHPPLLQDNTHKIEKRNQTEVWKRDHSGRPWSYDLPPTTTDFFDPGAEYTALSDYILSRDFNDSFSCLLKKMPFEVREREDLIHSLAKEAKNWTNKTAGVKVNLTQERKRRLFCKTSLLPWVSVMAWKCIYKC
jgi:hypothetical protein